MATMWIGPDETLEVGDVGFLVERRDITRGSATFSLQERPPYTNQSNEPRLEGWCGTWNDLSTHGRGCARVIKVARNGRALVKTLSGSELSAVVEELGYPDLAPEPQERGAPEENTIPNRALTKSDLLLIDAAPDLLAALREIVEQKDYQGFGDPVSRSTYIDGIARAAVAKATGEIKGDDDLTP
jgi:hypothetical protein